MTECGTETPYENALSAEDAVSIRNLLSSLVRPHLLIQSFLSSTLECRNAASAYLLTTMGRSCVSFLAATISTLIA